MCAHHDDDDKTSGYGNLTTVAWALLVMGLSLAGVIVIWVWFGHIGPSYSEDILAHQQRMLRNRFHLPPAQIVEDPKLLLTPPSLRKINQTDLVSMLLQIAILVEPNLLIFQHSVSNIADTHEICLSCFFRIRIRTTKPQILSCITSCIQITAGMFVPLIAKKVNRNPYISPRQALICATIRPSKEETAYQ